MKWSSVAAMGACAFSCMSASAFCRPQEQSINISISAQQSSDQAPPGDAKSEDSKSDKAKGIILLKRIAQRQDGQADQQAAGNVQMNVTVDAPPKIWLGVGLKSVEGDLARFLGFSEGVFIEEVFPDSPAAAAGLQPGDIILSFNGTRLAGPEDLVKALRAVDEQAQHKPGAEKPKADKQAENTAAEDKTNPQQAEAEVAYPVVKLTINRQGNEQAVEVTPKSRPQSFRVTAEAAGELNDGASFFYFGEPKVHSINKSVIVMKDKEGDVQVQIDRGEDGQTKIVVKDAKGERTIDEAGLKELPEKLRSAIENALKHVHKAGLHVEGDGAHLGLSEKVMEDVNEQVEKAFKQLGHASVKIDASMLPEQLKKLGEMNGVVVIGPEMGEVGEMAKKLAESGAAKAQVFMAMPQEIQSLQEQIVELKKQVEELKAELKASKK